MALEHSGAGAQGFEPQLTDPESAVLPLDDAPMLHHFTQFTHPLSSFTHTQTCDGIFLHEDCTSVGRLQQIQPPHLVPCRRLCSRDRSCGRPDSLDREKAVCSPPHPVAGPTRRTCLIRETKRRCHSERSEESRAARTAPARKNKPRASVILSKAKNHPTIRPLSSKRTSRSKKLMLGGRRRRGRW